MMRPVDDFMKIDPFSIKIHSNQALLVENPVMMS